MQTEEQKKRGRPGNEATIAVFPRPVFSKIHPTETAAALLLSMICSIIITRGRSFSIFYAGGLHYIIKKTEAGVAWNM